jgi:hypothetical protein
MYNQINNIKDEEKALDLNRRRGGSKSLNDLTFEDWPFQVDSS